MAKAIGVIIVEMSSAISFKITAKDGQARTGVLSTPHGRIKTPAFIPVGTKANVKTLDVSDLKTLEAPAVLANTYHLYLRPGEELIDKMGGLGEFMGWDGPTFTDSGGFQVFSLGFGLEHGVSKVSNIFPGEEKNKSRVTRKEGPLNEYRGSSGEVSLRGRTRDSLKTKKKLFKIDEDGVNFVSHLDGTKHRFTPEKSIEIQQKIGADIIFAFDECTSPLHDKKYTDQAMRRTHAWAKRSVQAWTNREKQGLYGIIQGGAYKDLRKESTEFICSLDTPGIAIGGSLGKNKQDMHAILDWTLPILPENQPRHLLGIGEIEDLISSSLKGIDTFDCVSPTRNARNGGLYISPKSGGKRSNKYSINIRAKRYESDFLPVDPGCECFTCSNHSRAYLRHLFATGELLAMRLGTIHNLHFVFNLMEKVRNNIESSTLKTFAKKWEIS